MITHEELEKVLNDLPKDILVKLYIQNTRGLFAKSIDQIKNDIISVKIDINLEKQRKVIDELDKHPSYTGNNVLEFITNHEQYEKINAKLKKLENEYDKLKKELREIK